MVRAVRRQEVSLRLPAEVTEAMRAELPQVAEKVVRAVMSEVPSYSEPFQGRMGRTIQSAVLIALGGFLDLASAPAGLGPGTRVESVFEAAYALGRGEARSGRTMDALASAYRVGARTAWRDMSATAVKAGLGAAELARFAELVFDYIDQISATSVSGHADEDASEARVRQRHIERLAIMLLAGDPMESLLAAAARAEWTPPQTLTAVILPESRVRGTRSQLDERTLVTVEELPELEDDAPLAALLVPDVGGRRRNALLRAVHDRGAVVGPAVPWHEVRASYLRAIRTLALDLPRKDELATLDSQEHLAELVLLADPAAYAELRERALAPLAELRASTAEKLTETLRSWLLHHGRRDDIAAELFVHPQTVRYRMGQLRELFGERLDDPRTILELTLALGVGRAPESGR